MRHTLLLTFALCLTLATAASAEQTYTTATGDRVGSLDFFRDCVACPEMIVLPPGSFRMGSTVAEADAARRRFFTSANIAPTDHDERLAQTFAALDIDPDSPEDGVLGYLSSDLPQSHAALLSANPFLNEMPAQDVAIDRPVAIGRNEVTRAEWAACVADGGCEQGVQDLPESRWAACHSAADCDLTPDDRIRLRLPNGPHPTDPRSPRTGVTYHEMTDYTSWLNRKLGADLYRVPTEAEWEYAARAGTTTHYAQGDSLSLDQANYLLSRREVVDGAYVWNHDLGSARALLPVDDLEAANGWGLRHMAGNAAEFTSSCADGPHHRLASSGPALAADRNRPDCRRSVKGGMYDGNVELARPAWRVALPPDHWAPEIGFRVLRDLSAE